MSGPADNPYGASKLAVDTALAEYARLHGFGAVSLRYFNVSGAQQAAHGSWLGERHTPETHLIPNVLAGGRQPRRPDIRRRLPHTRWHLHPGLHPRDGPSRRAPAGAQRLRARPAPDLQPRQWERLLSARGNRRVPRGHRTRHPGHVAPRRPGDPAILVASARRIQSDLGWQARNDLLAMVTDAWQAMHVRYPQVEE